MDGQAEALAALDRKGWEEHGDVRFATSLLGARCEALTPDDAVLVKARARFPLNATLQGIALTCGQAQSAADISRFLRAEFTSLDWAAGQEGMRSARALQWGFHQLKARLEGAASHGAQ
jgi:hypothetical protein